MSLPDPYLIGNGRWCSQCCPDGPPSESRLSHLRGRRRGCNECADRRRIVFRAEEIVANTLAENRAWRDRNRD